MVKSMLHVVYVERAPRPNPKRAGNGLGGLGEIRAVFKERKRVGDPG